MLQKESYYAQIYAGMPRPSDHMDKGRLVTWSSTKKDVNHTFLVG